MVVSERQATPNLRTYWRHAAGIAIGAIFVLSMIDGRVPAFMSLEFLFHRGPSQSPFTPAYLAVMSILVLLPAIGILAPLYGGRLNLYTRMRRPLRLVLGILLVPVILDWLFGTFASFFGTEAGIAVAFSTGAVVVAAYGLAVSLLGRQGEEPTFFRPVATLYLLVYMVWCLGSGALAAAQAVWIAGDRPYCIAVSGHPRGLNRAGEMDGPYGSIRSVLDLAGNRLYTYLTGYKDSSRWFFHGLLLVGSGPQAAPATGVEVWNWSRITMTFDRLPRAADQLNSPFNACRPVRHFLFRVGLG